MMDPELSRRDLLKTTGAVTLFSAAAAPKGASASQQTPLAIVERYGPLRIGRFAVEIDDVEVPGWQSVTIPGNQTETEDTDDGTAGWGETTFDSLEMERSVQSGDTRIFDWREEVRSGNVDEGRKEVTVTLMDEEGEPQIVWEFQGAWIKEYQPPALVASGDDRGAIATESITVDFETMMTGQNGEKPLPETDADFKLGSATVGEEVTFDASGSEPANAINSYEWDLGDGTIKNGAVITHTYDSAGEYDVSLTVKSGETSDTTTKQITVEDSPESEGMTVAVVLGDAEIVVDSATDVEIMLTGADNGVSVYDLDVSITGPGLFTAFEQTLQPVFNPSEIQDDGTTLSLEAAMGDNTYEPTKEVVIATATIEATEQGTLTFEPTGAEVSDLDTKQYEIVDQRSTEAEVLEGPPAPDPVIGEQSPQDLDGDGSFEDINADGTFDIFDIQALFSNLDNETVQNNPEAFNFAGDENTEEVTVFDVQAMFNQLQ